MTAVAGGAGLLVASVEPQIVFGSLTAGVVFTLAWHRAYWAVGLLVFATLLGTTTPGLVRDVGQASRALALIALTVIAGRIVLLDRRLPVWAIVSPFAPLLLVLAVSVVAAPVVPPDAATLLPYAALLLASALVAWRLSYAWDGGESALRAVALAYSIIAVFNVVAVAASPSAAFLEAGAYLRFQGLFENPNAVGALAFAGVPALVGMAFLRSRGSGTGDLPLPRGVVDG